MIIGINKTTLTNGSENIIMKDLNQENIAMEKPYIKLFLKASILQLKKLLTKIVKSVTVKKKFTIV